MMGAFPFQAVTMEAFPCQAAKDNQDAWVDLQGQVAFQVVTAFQAVEAFRV
jgi:hypothetical protein